MAKVLVRAQWSHAAMETFFKTIKAELEWRNTQHTRHQAELANFEYINGFIIHAADILH